MVEVGNVLSNNILKIIKFAQILLFELVVHSQ